MFANLINYPVKIKITITLSDERIIGHNGPTIPSRTGWRSDHLSVYKNLVYELQTHAHQGHPFAWYRVLATDFINLLFQ